MNTPEKRIWIIDLIKLNRKGIPVQTQVMCKASSPRAAFKQVETTVEAGGWTVESCRSTESLKEALGDRYKNVNAKKAQSSRLKKQNMARTQSLADIAAGNYLAILRKMVA